MVDICSHSISKIFGFILLLAVIKHLSKKMNLINEYNFRNQT